MNNQNTLFAQSTSYKEALVIVQAAPWEVTSSYGGGSSFGPEKIIQASSQLDFFNFKNKKKPKNFVHMTKVDQSTLTLSSELQTNAQKIMQERGACGNQKISAELNQLQLKINQESQLLNNKIYKNTLKTLQENKIPALLGGDHSVSLGAIQACTDFYKEVSVLHIDAHADLRKAYQGFTHSHASIMYNVMELNKAPKKLCSVSVRDFCEEEYHYANQHSDIKIFFDEDLKNSLFNGQTWKEQCKKIISELGAEVYISFDVDGLQASFCPNTGTPVPGGLSYNEATFLLEELSRQNKKVIGFDLCEVSCGNSNNQWDANIGARLLFKMSLICYNQVL